MFGDGSADYVTRTEQAVAQYEFENGLKRARAQSFGHNLVFSIALVLFWRALRKERRG
jgi:hypothetical protein